MILLNFSLLLVLTVVTGSPQKTVVTRGNNVIAAFTDGYVCYGQYEPQRVSCHRAIPSPADTLEMK